MRLLNVSLCAPYNEGFSYQDNIIAKYFSRLGFETSTIATTYEHNFNSIVKVNPSRYVNDDGVEIIRIDDDDKSDSMRRLRRYSGYSRIIDELNPDVIFLHGTQYMDTNVIADYVRTHSNVTLYVDNHADYFNSASNFLSRYVLHRMLWRHTTKVVLPYVTRFYGITSVSCDFLEREYGVPSDLVELLPLGSDEVPSPTRWQEIRTRTRRRLGLAGDDRVIVTGGKIDGKKNVRALEEAVRRMAPDVKLLVFGALNDKRQLTPDGDKVVYAGWADAEQVKEYFIASDIACFPGSASSMWMQTLSCGVPGVFSNIPGSNDVVNAPSSTILKDSSADGIHAALGEILETEGRLDELRQLAYRDREKYSYGRIARQAVRDVL